jgi:16S rRNA (uracil1498-N3)-methyltransferase
MQIFYIPQVDGEVVRLDEAESGHAVRVLRLKPGDDVVVTDGCGGWYNGVIGVAHHRHCSILIKRVQMDYGKRSFRVHLAVAPVKNNDRTEWFLEKATEIGIDQLTPLQCTYSERKNLNATRLQKIAVAAMKQSLKAWLPVIDEWVPFADFVKRPFVGTKLIAHCHPGEKPHMKNVITAGENVLVLIGPEGDFSPEEVSLALQNGFMEVSLGKSRLRTETAALVAVHTVALVNE